MNWELAASPHANGLVVPNQNRHHRTQEHENKSFTLNIYSAGCSFEQKQKAIQHLNFNLEK